MEQATDYIAKVEVQKIITFGTLFAYRDRVEFISRNGKKHDIFPLHEIKQTKVSMGNLLELHLPSGKEESFALPDNAMAQQWVEMLQKLKVGETVEDIKYVETETAPQATPSSQSVEEEDAPFEIVTLNENGVTVGILMIVAGFLINLFFSIVLGNMFGFSFKVAGYVIMIYTVFAGIKSIRTAKVKAYRAVCPCCNYEFAFPVEELNVLCPKCRKRIILQDDTFKVVE